ncbi:MAG: hypothetical protein IT262_05075 [Saprospiraceae bacterium]|nr:hypothetical protein [Saprospiraceae bacterium]
MNTVTGKIVLKESGMGLSNLLVVIYDVDPDSRTGETATSILIEGNPSTSTPLAIQNNPAQGPTHFPEGLGDRIGSVLTDGNGAFTLQYEDTEFRVRNEDEKRPDLLLIVLAPERAGASSKDQLLFVSTEIRQNAGRIENYLIQIAADQLERAGLEVPGTSNPIAPANSISLLEGSLIKNKALYDSRKAILQKYIDVEHEKHVIERDASFTSKIKEDISKLPKAFRNSKYFVADGDSVSDKTEKSLKQQLKDRINQQTQKKPFSSGFIYLTKDQIQNYQEYLDPETDMYILPEDIIEQEILPKLFGGTNDDGSGNDFLMDHPTVKLCKQSAKGDFECKFFEDPDNEPSNTSNSDTNEMQDTPAQTGDVPLYIAKQMELATSPEGIVNVGVDTLHRANPEQIGTTISDLELRKGPADVPAYFDFHRITMAFEHVWSEATDAGILEDGEALYNELVGVGSTPKTNLWDTVKKVQSANQFVLMGPAKDANSQPSREVIFEFPDAVAVWPQLSYNERVVVEKIAILILGKYTEIKDAAASEWLLFLQSDLDKDLAVNGNKLTNVPYISAEHLLNNQGYEVIAFLRRKGQRIIDNALEQIEEKQTLKTDFDRFQKAAELAEELKKKLKTKYSFTYFAANSTERSINYGVVLTYRQRWDPLNYQVGELVKTIPLAPKEVRRYNAKTVVKKTRSQKEMEDNLRITKTDSSDTNRAEAEIVNKAFNKTAFSMNTSGEFEMPFGEAMKMGISVGTNMNMEAQRESNQTKKEFREAVVKSAQEFKNERRVEISTDSYYESEITESGEISNPNDELTVTYLFYDLQRQFRINERLHRMRPVIFVAQEMPAPHEIDDDWIMTNDWTIRRVLMDDSFSYAFDCIMSIRGDQLMLSEIEKTVKEQRKVVRDLRQNVKFFTDETGRLSRLMQAAVNKEANLVEDRDIWDNIPVLGKIMDVGEGALKGAGKFLGMGSGDDPQEATRIRQEGVKSTFERAERERRELMGRLEGEIGVLNGLTKQVAEKRKAINEKEVLIARLKNHIKDNILHYMQAIWRSEHRDQRFFRLFNTKVPALTATSGQYNLKIKNTPSPSPVFDAVVNNGLDDDQQKTRYEYTFSPVVSVEEKTLEEVAELDTLLGFKGNYMIFPLRKSNVITDFMMSPYVDSEFQLLDPDAPGNWTLDEFEQLYCCLKKSLGDSFSEVEAALKDLYKEILTDPLRPGEVITVPTGSLFIEALPGAHPILENFKALHRAVDVKKVQAEVRKMELENIRYAARLLNDERDDPDTERKVVVENGAGSIMTITD